MGSFYIWVDVEVNARQVIILFKIIVIVVQQIAQFVQAHLTHVQIA